MDRGIKITKKDRVWRKTNTYNMNQHDFAILLAFFWALTYVIMIYDLFQDERLMKHISTLKRKVTKFHKKPKINVSHCVWI